ncbi:MAG: MFS transporter [Promethearchaeota archaeon]
MSIETDISDPKNWEIASTKKMISYSFGFTLTLYLLIAYNSFIFYFYEVEVGLKAELVATAIILYTIWVLATGPILGYLIDRPFKWSKRWGFRAPWIIGAAIPTLVFYLLIFIPPNIDAKSNPLPVFWYLLITSCIYGTFLTIYRQNLQGGFPNQFREDYERRRASALGFIFPGSILFFMSIIPLFIIVYGDKSSFFITALISVIILALCLIFLLPGILESEDLKLRYLQGYESKEKLHFLKMLKITFKQKNFRLTIITFTLTNISTALVAASSIYFFKDIIGLPLSFSVIPSIIYFITVILFVPFWASFSRKHGNKKAYTVGLFLLATAQIPYLWITTLWEIFIFSVLRGIAGSCTMFIILPISSDCYDEVTLACGRHQEATLYGIRNFFVSSSILFAALIIGGIHIYTGYNQDPNAIQTPLALWGIRIHRALIPMILCFTACILVLFLYDLESEKKIALKAKLRELGL